MVSPSMIILPSLSITFIFKVNYSVKVAGFEKEGYRNASLFDWKNFQNNTLKRLFTKMTDIGISALEDQDKLHDVC
jgi:hypothetical protein